MDENTLIVAVLTILGGIYGFYLKIKKEITGNIESNNKPINDLNKSIIELNSTIKHMNDDYKSLSSRVTEHGKEIDDLKIDVCNLKTEVRIYHKHE